MSRSRAFFDIFFLQINIFFYFLGHYRVHIYILGSLFSVFQNRSKNVNSVCMYITKSKFDLSVMSIEQLPVLSFCVVK